MGDFDIFQPGELESIFWKYHGPKDESIFQLLGRSYKRFNDMIVRPERHEYSDSELAIASMSTRIFFFESCNVKLKCVFWEWNGIFKRCILYLHTNTRSIVDAKEVLPLCHALQCSLLSFDLPGCGQSEGDLSFTMANDVNNFVTWLQVNTDVSEVILWARGMSCAPAIEFCSRQPPHPLVKQVVLDSPFTSIKAMTGDAIAAIRAKGYYIPKFVLSFCESRARSQIKDSLGGDIYSIDSIKYAPNCTIPCVILSATQDDYIPACHGKVLASVWGGKAKYKSFPGRHFGVRPVDLILSLKDILSTREDCLQATTSVADSEGLNVYFIQRNDTDLDDSSSKGTSRESSSTSTSPAIASCLSESDISKLLLPSKAKDFFEKSKSSASLFARNGFC